VPYVRTVKTAAGATAVQIVYCSRRRARNIEHIGSGRGESEAELFKAAADCRRPGRVRPRIGRQVVRGQLAGDHLLAGGVLRDALCRAYEVVGFDKTAQGDEAFRQLVLARIIESASEQDSLRVLETGIDPPSCSTVNRGLPVYSRPETIVFADSRSASGSKTEPARRSSSFVKTARPVPHGTHQNRRAHYHRGRTPHGDLRGAIKQIRRREAAH